MNYLENKSISSYRNIFFYRYPKVSSLDSSIMLISFHSFDLSLTFFREAEKGWNIAREAGMTPGVNDDFPFPRRLGGGSNDPKGSISHDTIKSLPAIPQKRLEAYSTSKM